MKQQILFPRPNPYNLPVPKKQDFKFISKLGKGAFGEVGRYLHIDSNIEYAIKIIPIENMSPKQIAIIRKQLQILYKVQSQYIVCIRDHFEVDKSIHIITQYIDGKDLYKSIFKPKKIVPMQTLAKMVYQICLGLQALHQNNIIHRDLKLENIVLSEGRIKIVDLGCSNYYGQDTNRLTRHIGTKPYWCPQLLYGENQDDRFDIWCLGVIIYELIVLKSPFAQPNIQEKIKNIDYKIPQFLQSEKELVDLLQRIFTQKTIRIRVKQILNHSWMKKYQSQIFNKSSIIFENYFDLKTVQKYRLELIAEIEKIKKQVHSLKLSNQQLEKVLNDSKRQLRNY